MTLVEAFALVEKLPQEERLVIGILLNDPPRWSAGSINDPSVWLGFESSVVRVIEEYRAGDKDPTVSITRFGRGHVLVALGQENARSVADALDEAVRLLRRQASNT